MDHSGTPAGFRSLRDIKTKPKLLGSFGLNCAIMLIDAVFFAALTPLLSSSSMGVSVGRGRISPRRTARCHDAVENPNVSRHSRSRRSKPSG